MSKMNEMAASIEELRNAAAAINDVANWLAEAFSTNEPAEEAPAPDPVLTLEEVRAVLAEKSRKGHTAEIRSLLQKYGADKLSQLDPANYKALLAEVEDIGAPEESTDSLGRGGAAE
ncbi:DNA ligase [Bacillota bacterium LX-D]|nr:DNA ligase [Bacillota bacterium LX-D]